MAVNYFKILKSIRSKEKSVFDIDIEEQKTFLNNLPEPSNDIARSFNQYRCQIFFVNKKIIFLYNIASLLLILPLISLYVIKRFLFQNKKQVKTELLVALGRGTDKDILPRELIAKYPNAQYSNGLQSGFLTLSDLKFIFKIWKKHPLSFYFLAKNIVKIAFYSRSFQTYNPNAIVVNSEYSYTSSILTYYCNKNSIQHVNVMHGERFFQISRSFFRYDLFYVWDDHYAELYKKLRAEPNQFEVLYPESMLIDKSTYTQQELVDYKYFLSSYTEKELVKIISTMDKLQKKGYKIIYRPHPRYSDINLLKKYVNSNLIEDPFDVSIKHSISNTLNAVSLYSTVLLQASYTDVKVIIDDLLDKEKFNTLKKLDYIMFEKKHELLSKIL